MADETTFESTQLMKKLNELSVTKENLKTASDLSLFLGFLSIIASIFTWYTAKGEDRAHGERFGIFVGLWVPSFFILSNRLARKADEIPEVE